MSPFRPAGAVYGTLMNFRSEHEALGARMHEAPYKAPPKAPVLYVKPANTWCAPGEAIVIPQGVEEVEVGATLAMVMAAPGVVGGWVLVNDVSLPHASFFRPAVKQRCFDRSLGLGETAAPVDDPAALALEVRVNGELRQTVRFDALVRPPAQLLADVSEFMTLGEGELLMLGCEAQRPRVRAGDTVELSAPGLGVLRHTVEQEAA
ncbi:fumarylacetoacetate hydrolase family protein [Ramlibacter rhizophilus]|uniref:Fumarylacetoacetate hydrolase n=1 Tax=Ramlibacter rhizophilus TaxID=1781167 RepID=A0A4Z0BFG6_9BURK|nr:fumarylacetoacetate hydrolase family protein [Ramlibacter rhizophilus]TFY98052.1 fumarylacetoacetate hydrolase [Ramlibacter rhizophilus]